MFNNKKHFSVSAAGSTTSSMADMARNVFTRNYALSAWFLGEAFILIDSRNSNEWRSITHFENEEQTKELPLGVIFKALRPGSFDKFFVARTENGVRMFEEIEDLQASLAYHKKD